MQARYIRDSANGSSINTSNHWTEIQAFQGTTNVALNKTVTGNGALNTYSHNSFSVITDGIISLDNYADGLATCTAVTVDLGSVIDIGKITVWHYYGDGRTYHGTKTEVSTDGTSWIAIFDSTVSGEYAETSAGHTITLAAATLKKYLIKSTGNLYTVVNNAPSEIIGTLNAALFQQYGVDSIPSSALLALPNPSVLYWQSSDTEPLAGVYANVSAIPYPQTIVTYEADMSDPTIAGIKSITPSVDVTGNGTALFAISFDSGTTYNAYTGTVWQTVDITSTNDFTAKGMTSAILSAITQQQWSDFLTTHTTKKYKISVLLNRPSIDDNIRIKNIQVLYLNQ